MGVTVSQMNASNQATNPNERSGDLPKYHSPRCRSPATSNEDQVQSDSQFREETTVLNLSSPSDCYQRSPPSLPHQDISHSHHHVLPPGNYQIVPSSLYQTNCSNQSPVGESVPYLVTCSPNPSAPYQTAPSMPFRVASPCNQDGSSVQTQYGASQLPDHRSIAAATHGSRTTVATRSSASSPALTHRPHMQRHSASPRASPVPSKHNSDSNRSRHTCTPPPPTYQDAIGMVGPYHQARNDSAYFSFGNNSHQSQQPGLVSQPILTDETSLVTPVLRRQHIQNNIRYNPPKYNYRVNNRLSGNPSREENPEYYKVAPLNCIVFVAGVGTLIIGGAAMAYNPYGSFLYAGMWCGASYIALSCIASAGVRQKSRCHTIITLIVAVMTLCLCLFYTTWCIVGITQDVKHFTSCFNDVTKYSVSKLPKFHQTSSQYFLCFKLSDADIPPKTPYELKMRLVLESLALFFNLIVMPASINYIMIFRQILMAPCYSKPQHLPRMNYANGHAAPVIL